MNKKTKYNLIGIVTAVLLVALDQWTKLLAVKHLMNQKPFGILQGQKLIFLLCTVLVLVVLGFYYNRMPEDKKYLPLRVVGVLLGAGAVGNLIDRMAQSYVVDFLYFKLIDFPIFNVADCYVTAGAILLAVLILFVYKDEELGFLSLKKKHE